MRDKRLTPIAAQHLAQPLGVFYRQRIAQAVLLLKPQQVFGGNVGIILVDRQRVVRHHLDQRKHQDADDEQDRYRLHEPADDVPGHLICQSCFPITIQPPHSALLRARLQTNALIVRHATI